MRQRRAWPTVVVVLVVVAVFAGILFAKAQAHRTATPGSAGQTATTGAALETDGASITTAHNDAVADYDAALKTGKPIYLLFHSLS